MSQTEQEKQAEAVNKDRLAAFDAGVANFFESNGMDKEAFAKEVGAKDFKELTGWTLNMASAVSAQAEKEAQEKAGEAK